MPIRAATRSKQYEVNFGDDAVTLERPSNDATIRITVRDADPVNKRLATLAVPRSLFDIAIAEEIPGGVKRRGLYQQSERLSKPFLW